MNFMECSLKNRNDLIANYLMGNLSDEETKSFEEHYFQCEVCFKELKAAEDAISLIKDEGESSFSSKQKKINLIGQILNNLTTPKRRKLNWGIAIALVIAVVLIFIMLLPGPGSRNVSDNKVTSVDKDTLEGKEGFPKKPDKDLTLTEGENEKSIPRKGNLLADISGPSFEPNPYLEEWITENIRSGGEVTDSIFSPKVGEKFYDEDILFKWSIFGEDKGSVFLKIIDNKEKEIFRSKPELSKFPILTLNVKAESFKQPGLYYWRIENKNEVLFVGKFYFLKD